MAQIKVYVLADAIGGVINEIKLTTKKEVAEAAHSRYMEDFDEESESIECKAFILDTETLEVFNWTGTPHIP